MCNGDFLTCFKPAKSNFSMDVTWSNGTKNSLFDFKASKDLRLIKNPHRKKFDVAINHCNPRKSFEYMIDKVCMISIFDEHM